MSQKCVLHDKATGLTLHEDVRAGLPTIYFIKGAGAAPDHLSRFDPVDALAAFNAFDNVAAWIRVQSADISGAAQ